MKSKRTKSDKGRDHELVVMDTGEVLSKTPDLCPRCGSALVTEIPTVTGGPEGFLTLCLVRGCTWFARRFVTGSEKEGRS